MLGIGLLGWHVRQKAVLVFVVLNLFWPSGMGEAILSTVSGAG